MNMHKFCERLNSHERRCGGTVRAVVADGRVHFTVQAPDREAALKSIVGAAFGAGVCLDADPGCAVFNNFDGTFCAAMDA